MKELTKENVFVKADTKEKTQQLYKVLTNAKQPMSSFCESQLKQGKTDYPYFMFSVGCEYCGSFFGADVWLSRGYTEVTIEKLAEILGVKVELTDAELLAYARENYPIGTQFTSIEMSDDSLTRFVIPYGGKKSLEFYISADAKRGDKRAVRCGINTSDGGCSNPVLWVEGVGWAPILNKVNLNRTVTRKDLSEVFELVCDGWKSRITELLSKDPFADSFVVEEKLVKKAYQDASGEQRNWLKKYLPAPTIKEERQVTSTWGLADDTGYVMYTYPTEETAKRNISESYPHLVKVKGSYTIEVEDDSYCEQLPF